MPKQVVVKFHKFWGVYYPGESAAFAPEVAETLIKRGTAELVETVEVKPQATAGAEERLTTQPDKGAKRATKGGEE